MLYRRVRQWRAVPGHARALSVRRGSIREALCPDGSSFGTGRAIADGINPLPCEASTSRMDALTRASVNPINFPGLMSGVVGFICHAMHARISTAGNVCAVLVDGSGAGICRCRDVARASTSAVTVGGAVIAACNIKLLRRRRANGCYRVIHPSRRRNSRSSGGRTGYHKNSESGHQGGGSMQCQFPHDRCPRCRDLSVVNRIVLAE